jgi:hypothetical protein
MATYTPVHLAGTGSVSTQTFTSGSPLCVVNFNNLDVSQSLAWTSSVDIPAGDAVLQGTAGISCIIT